MNYSVFIDGSCSGNPGTGGIGVLIQSDYTKFSFCNFCLETTTNNRMEIAALIYAIEKFQFCGIKRDDKITIFTDSQYLVLGWNSLIKWRSAKWIKSDKKPVLNKDLWEYLYTKYYHYNINIQWIAREFNEQANYLAQLSAFQKISVAIKWSEEIII